MRKITMINMGTYNFLCYQLERMGITVADIKSAGMRHKFYDSSGRVIAELDERKNHGLIYDYK